MMMDPSILHCREVMYEERKCMANSNKPLIYKTTARKDLYYLQIDASLQPQLLGDIKK